MFHANRVLSLVLLTLALGRLPAQEPAVHLPPGCDSGSGNLNVPAGHVLSFRTYALGVQVYRWDGATWVFVAPKAILFASSDYQGQVGIHYAGPTWESNGGGKVVAARVAGCTPDPTAIPWLLLDAVSASGPGLLGRTTFIQRLHTVGGLAPAAPGMFVGQQMEVPYTAQYWFYRAQD
jgi:hypothetical protein